MWEYIKKLVNYKLGSGDALLIGTTIGYLVLKSGQFDVAAMSAATSDDIYWIKAMGLITAVPMYMLWGVGLLLKDSWIWKILGAINLYFAVYQLVYELVTIKPYVVALNGFLD